MDKIAFALIGALIGGAAAFAICWSGKKESDSDETFNTKLIIQKLDLIMAKSQERFDALMLRLDAVTNDIATDYATLLAAVQEGGVSEESFAKHEANIAKLEALGASVENPVPPVEPPVEG